MARGRGFKEYLGFGVESTNGTAVAATSWLKVLGNTPRVDRQPTEDPILREDMATEVLYMAEGSGFDTNLRVNYEGHELLYHSLLGTYNFTDLTTAGLHTFTYNPTDTHDFLEGLTLYSNQGLPTDPGVGDNDGIRIAGCLPTQCTWTFNARDYLREAWTFEGAGHSWTPNQTPTFPTVVPVLGRHAGTTGGSAGAKIGFTAGTTNVSVRSGTITFAMPRDEDGYVYGNTVRPRMERTGPPVIEFEFECEMDDQTKGGKELLEDIAGDSPGASAPHELSITHETGDNIPGHTGPYSWKITGNFYVFGQPASVQDNGLVRFNLTGRFTYDSGGARPTVQLQNGTTTKVTS